MSFEAVAMAVTDQRASGNAKLVLILLANCHNPQNGCYPSIQYIAKCAGLSENAVRENIKRLVEDGIVSVKQRKHQSSCYTFDWESTITGNRESTESEGETISKNKEETVNTPHTPQGGLDDLFEQFWKQYPRKEGKQAAKRAFKRAVKAVGGITKHPAIFSGLLTSPRLKREKRYVPHASTWLNDGGWMDEPEANSKPRVY